MVKREEQILVVAIVVHVMEAKVGTLVAVDTEETGKMVVAAVAAVVVAVVLVDIEATGRMGVVVEVTEEIAIVTRGVKDIVVEKGMMKEAIVVEGAMMKEDIVEIGTMKEDIVGVNQEIGKVDTEEVIRGIEKVVIVEVIKVVVVVVVVINTREDIDEVNGMKTQTMITTIPIVIVGAVVVVSPLSLGVILISTEMVVKDATISATIEVTIAVNNLNIKPQPNKVDFSN